jgi:hypothetical protein
MHGALPPVDCSLVNAEQHDFRRPGALPDLVPHVNVVLRTRAIALD